MSNWISRIDSLPVIAVQLKEPTDDECIDEMLGDARLIITHQYLPVHHQCYVLSVSGNIPDRAAIVAAMTAKFDAEPSEVNKDAPAYWVITWKSSSKTLPYSYVREKLGDEEIDRICRECRVSDARRAIVDELVALVGYFDLHHQAARPYLDSRLQGVPLEEANTVIAALHQINMRYIELTTGSRPSG